MVAPKDPNFHANRCVELLESGNYKEAVREARKAVKLSPGKVECMKLLEIAQLLYDDASLKKPTISFREAERRGLLLDPKPLNFRLPECAKEFNCRQCGDCCKYRWEIEVDWRDISRWISQRLDFILIWLVFQLSWLLSIARRTEIEPPTMMIDNGHDNLFYGWRQRYACRFLVRHQGKYYCAIHAVKPLTCQLFPFEICKDGFLHIRKDAKDYCKYIPECSKNEANCFDSSTSRGESMPHGEMEEIKENIDKFLEYMKNNCWLKEKADLLDKVHHHPYRIFITSSVGIAILEAYQKEQYENIKRILKTRNAIPLL